MPQFKIPRSHTWGRQFIKTFPSTVVSWRADPTLQRVWFAALSLEILNWTQWHFLFPWRGYLISFWCYGSSLWSLYWLSAVAAHASGLCHRWTQTKRCVTVSWELIRRNRVTPGKIQLVPCRETEYLFSVSYRNEITLVEKMYANICYTSVFNRLWLVSLWFQEVSCCKSAVCHQSLSVRWVQPQALHYMRRGE